VIIAHLLSGVADPGCSSFLDPEILHPATKIGKKLVVLPFYLGINFTEVKFFLFFEQGVPVEKKIRVN
jgi:hypothetical protein